MPLSPEIELSGSTSHRDEKPDNTYDAEVVEKKRISVFFNCEMSEFIFFLNYIGNSLF